MAEIVINGFIEKFQSGGSISPYELDEFWIIQLKRLKEENSIVLPCWARDGIASRGLVIWRENGKAHIQDMLFLEGFEYLTASAPKRETITEDGDEISEWTIDLESIELFLKSKEQNHS